MLLHMNLKIFLIETLNEINKIKPVLPKPSVNRIIQHRLAEKDFINKLNIRTTRYVSIEKKSDIEARCKI